MSQAVITLLAVLLGAMLTLGTHLLLQRRQDSARMFTAARVLLSSVFRAISVIDDSLGENRFTFSRELTRRLMADWPAQRPVLAERLNDEEWTVLQDAFEALAQLQEMRSGGLPGAPLTADVRGRLEACRDRLTGPDLGADPLSPPQILGSYTEAPPIRDRLAIHARALLSTTIGFARRKRR